MGKKKKKEKLICKHCGAEIEKSSKYCTTCGTKAKSSILLFFLVMLPLFMCVFITASMSSLIYNVISEFKYGQEFLVETIFAFVVLVVTILSGNSYIFTQEKEGLLKSLLSAWPILIIAGVNLLSSIISLAVNGNVNPFNIFNLVLYCFAIGVYEELLCRGWLFNEFIERFGNTKKQVLLSIILSSLIFGGIHLVNVFTTSQGLLVTLAQIIQASASGMFLASIYYKNKNILSVIILHALYDFAILLGSSSLIKDCTTGVISNGMTVYLIVSSILIACFFILSTIAILRRCDNWNNLHSKKKDSKKEYKQSNLLINVSIIIIFIFMLVPNTSKIEGYEDYQICYNYKEIELKNYHVTESYLDKHNMRISKTTTIVPDNNDNLSMVPINKTEYFNLSAYIDKKSYNVILENKDTGDKVILNSDNELPIDLVVYEADSYYAISYYVNTVSGSTAYYAKINKSAINKSREYLEQVKESTIAIELPTITRIAYLQVVDNKDNYIYLSSYLDDEFVIDKDGNIYLLDY